MGRPRSVMPTVREKRRGDAVFLRCWFGGKWNELGKKGDVDAATLRARLMAIVAGCPLPPVKERRKPRHAITWTVKGLVSEYLNSTAAPKDPCDRVTMKRAGHLLADHIGDAAPAASLTAAAFDAWRESLCGRRCERWQGREKGIVQGDRLLSERYITRLTNAIKRLYRWAAKCGHVPAAVAAGIQLLDKLAPGRAPLPTPRGALTPAKYADGLRRLPIHLADACRILRGTGMRPGELCSLTPDQVHRRGVVAVGERLVNLSKEAKGHWLYLPERHKLAWRGKPRPIAIPPAVQKVLAKYLRGEPDQRPWKYTTGSFDQVLRKAGVPWTPYVLRRAFLTEVSLSKGARVAQAKAGHADLKTTSGYLDFDPRALFA